MKKQQNNKATKQQIQASRRRVRDLSFCCFVALLLSMPSRPPHAPVRSAAPNALV
jgi:hypothetical protein